VLENCYYQNERMKDIIATKYLLNSEFCVLKNIDRSFFYIIDVSYNLLSKHEIFKNLKGKYEIMPFSFCLEYSKCTVQSELLKL
jgi:hypothetical protein